MAHTLNLNVCAEGVETEGQREFLTSLGCDAIQGYLISRPVNGNDLADQVLAEILNETE